MNHVWVWQWPWREVPQKIMLQYETFIGSGIVYSWSASTLHAGPSAIVGWYSKSCYIKLEFWIRHAISFSADYNLSQIKTHFPSVRGNQWPHRGFTPDRFFRLARGCFLLSWDMITVCYWGTSLIIQWLSSFRNGLVPNVPIPGTTLFPKHIFKMPIGHPYR